MMVIIGSLELAEAEDIDLLYPTLWKPAHCASFE